MFELITPLSYWVLTVLWLVILVLYLTKLKYSKAAGGAVAVLLTILAIDAFRTVIESIYFGLYFNSLFGLLPKGVHDVLSQPAILIIPKLINVVAGLLVLFLLIRRWVPREIQEREEWISALQESEEQVRNLLNSTAEAIYGLDIGGRCTFCNPACIEILGYEREDELLGQHMHNLIHHTRPDGEPYPAEECLIYKAFQDGKGIHNDAEVLWRKDNTSFPAEYWSYPLHRDGKLTGSVVTFLDITERKKAERTVLMAKEEAVNANMAKSEFLASMSHELRTPLNAVLGFAQILQSDSTNPLTPKQIESIEYILEGGNHLLELVNHVLDLSRIEADQLQLSFDDVNVSQVVADCVALTIPLGKPRGITISNELDGGQTQHVRADRLRLKQALFNLLSNAVKYNNEGGNVTVTSREIDKRFLRIFVTDTGTGIAEKDHARVFQMFDRLEAPSALATDGVGIGLSVTKLLVEKMAGRIGFESEKGVGSTFWIELPLVSNDQIVSWDDTPLIGIDAIDQGSQDDCLTSQQGFGQVDR